MTAPLRDARGTMDSGRPAVGDRAVKQEALTISPDQLTKLGSKVCGYFQDFIDSDFKRQQAPRRRIVLQSDSGFRAGMRTSPYPGLDRDLWALLSRPTSDEATLTVTPRKYTRPISDVLQRVVSEQIRAIPQSSITSVRAALVDKATSSYTTAVQDPEEWIEGVVAHFAEKVGEHIIRPLIAHLDGPLKSQAYWVIDSLHAAEADLIDRVAGDLARFLPEALAKLLATGESKPLTDAAEQFFTLDGTHQALVAFFQTFSAADAYLELRDLETYVSTSDGLQLYLYVGAVRYRSNQYPVFFLPVDVARSADGNGYTLKVVNHLFANRKAIDYVLQELAAGASRAWVSPIPERITYLTPQQSIYEEARLLFGRVANAMDLGGKIGLSSTAADASTSQVTLSSALFLAAFERADEALLNDYEELLDMLRKGGAQVVSLFEGIVGGVLKDNPTSIAPQINAEWDSLPMVDRLLAESPVPLNEEQRKVLLAVTNPDGKIIVVGGPPGTGKSHVITAIAAHCALSSKSCLVLSDKTEALDVVQDKLSEAMSRVRHDREFPNPILRIGQQATNFRRLTSNQTLTKVSAYGKAMRANGPRLQAERESTCSQLKNDINAMVKSLGGIELAAVQSMHQDEAELAELAPSVLDTLHAVTDAKYLPELEAIAPHLDALQSYLEAVFAEGDFNPGTLADRARRDALIGEFAKGNSTGTWSLFEALDAQQVRTLSALVISYDQLRMPVFGYLFRGGQVRELERQLNSLPVTQPLRLKERASTLQGIVAGANALRLKLENAGLGSEFVNAYRVLAAGASPSPAASGAAQAIALLRRIDPAILDSLLAQPVDDARLWPLAVRFLAGWLRTRKAFMDVPQFDFAGEKAKLERLDTMVMNGQVDGRLINFMENYKTDARTLAALIGNRQKFPEEKFDQVRESFPVILANIREYAEVMPLAPDMFDVVVLDEASQVSVAQALPALLRAKKIVVLGDVKQFSNVKSANASIATNEKYLTDLKNHFKAEISTKADALQRLANFDVKKSILEFCQACCNYEVMLLKHFRSYPELIGYSSRNFYGGQLQALKIRGVPVDDVIQFDLVDTTGKRTTRGVNEAEADFILERLVELLDEENPPTVGVITPFREQQTHLSKLLFGHAHGRDFEDKLRLKVMTFDSCQGEERNIIFYSMVATREHDALNYVFPVSLDDAEQAVEEKLRVQRLNVGFSRAQEMVWFVHSKPLSEFRGAIGQALHHYANVLEKAKDLPSAEDTDQASPMEAKVLEWFRQTPFYQANVEHIEVFAQFEVSEYLRQLDVTYQHPKWRVDFLVTFRSPKGSVPIVIEYDGLREHFTQYKKVHVGNHDRYLNEADVERQLTLESYGYRFLRINRFNLGADPVATMSERLSRLVEIALADPVSGATEHVTAQAAGLANRDLRECSRCKSIKPPSAFFDPALRDGEGGMGRVCITCKGGPAKAKAVAKRKRRWRR